MEQRHVIMGTAGHIDHGKTELIRVLTGIDTDRLKEEKERGITIELGFAHLDLPRSGRLGIIDVPGHERFVRNMLAGASGIDFVLLVIAADESVMPQTREHLDICRLLDIRRGLVAITKIDLVEEEWLELVREDVVSFTQGTFLEGAPILPVSARTGAGLDALKAAIDEVASAVEARPVAETFRIPVDRVFTIKGFGTVITGTVVAGEIREGETVEVFPAGVKARLRGIEVHGQRVAVARAGQRAALNLQGTSKDEIRRGMVVARPGTLAPCRRFSARCHHLPSAARPLLHRARVHLHAGTQEVIGRVLVLEGKRIDPGSSALVQIELESPVVVLPGDRFVIRSFSPVVTIGGGVILRLDTRRARRLRPRILETLRAIESGSPATVLETLLRAAGWEGADRARLEREYIGPAEAFQETLDALLDSGTALPVGRDGTTLLHRDVIAEIQERVAGIVEDFHRRFPLRQGMSKEEVRSRLPRKLAPDVLDSILAAMATDQRLVIQGQYLRAPGFEIRLTPAQEQLRDRLIQLYDRAGYRPPLLSEAREEHFRGEPEFETVLKHLLEIGELIRINEQLLFSRRSVERMEAALRRHFARQPTINVGEFKDLLGISRKFAVPLLEYFDAVRLTRRRGNERVLRNGA
jgi:selenocysteine-specific elongation factor